MSHDYDFDSSDLDEFLAEYVDGTMDPVVRGAFEEFLRVYPEVRAHVDCLASLRTQLCKLGDDCRCQAPEGFQDRLKEQLECEMSDTVVLEHWAPQLNIIALAFSLAILALAVGLSNVGEEALAENSEAELRAKGSMTLVAERPQADDLDGAPVVNSTFAGFGSGRISMAHQVSMPDMLPAAFDRPVLMSVRRDLVALRTPVMTITP